MTCEVTMRGDGLNAHLQSIAAGLGLANWGWQKKGAAVAAPVLWDQIHFTGLGKPPILVACLAGPSGNSL